MPGNKREGLNRWAVFDVSINSPGIGSFCYAKAEPVNPVCRMDSLLNWRALWFDPNRLLFAAAKAQW
ncbi:MAG: hypothetical protein R3C45_20420 [Phycisphaerales bacterium]